MQVGKIALSAFFWRLRSITVNLGYYFRWLRSIGYLLMNIRFYNVMRSRYRLLKNN